MFLAKIFQSSRQLFEKNVISFLVIRRYDFGKETEDILRYIAVKRKGSVFYLRQKIWHLLELPDFCDEVIVLRSSNGTEIPLTELHRGNKPENPFILEVWSPQKLLRGTLRRSGEEKMITYSNESKNTICEITTVENSLEKSLNVQDEQEKFECKPGYKENPSYILRNDELRHPSPSRSSKLRGYNGISFGQNDYAREFNNIKSDLSCKMSSSSIRFMLPGRKKEKDSFAHMLQKIQNDLSALSSKIGVIEEKI